MMLRCGNWVTGTLRGSIIERPIDPEIIELRRCGFDVGAIVVRKYVADSQRTDPTNWCVISRVADAPKVTTRGKEWFFLNSISTSSASTGHLSYAVDEILLINPAPTAETVKFYLEQKGKNTNVN